MTPTEFDEAVRNVVNTTISQLSNELKAAKADILQLANENRQLRDTLAVGKGTLHASAEFNEPKLNAEEAKRLLPARLEAATLAEVALTDAAMNGVTLTNERELDAWFSRKSEVRSNAE